jgi:hypothetical protein
MNPTFDSQRSSLALHLLLTSTREWDKTRVTFTTASRFGKVVMTCMSSNEWLAPLWNLDQYINFNFMYTCISLAITPDANLALPCDPVILTMIVRTQNNHDSATLSSTGRHYSIFPREVLEETLATRHRRLPCYINTATTTKLTIPLPIHAAYLPTKTSLAAPTNGSTVEFGAGDVTVVTFVPFADPLLPSSGTLMLNCEQTEAKREVNTARTPMH